MTDTNQNEILGLVRNSADLNNSQKENLGKLIENRQEDDLDHSQLNINDEICCALVESINRNQNIDLLKIDLNNIGYAGAVALA